MCGRYSTSRRPEELVEDYEIEFTKGDGPGTDLAEAGGEADFNVAPTKVAPVVLTRRPRGEPRGAASGDDADGEPDDESEDLAQPDAEERLEPVEPEPVRWLRGLTWGLVPSWAKDRSVGARMINARVETLLDKTFRRPALLRRCLVPADGWYEWQVSPTETGARGKPVKQPFFMRPIVDDAPIAFAGIYEFWRDRAAHPDDPTAWLTTFAVITQPAEPGLTAIHDRMPLVLPQDRWRDWLDPDLQDADSVRALLAPPVAGRFAAYPVSTRVNAVANNGPELLEELPREQLRGVLDPVTGELIGGGDVPLF